ncbi:MAG: glycosyltransferase family 39 protein [Candidatus Atribacteria bacterium]|nr:glycosyltransferase family 39 protein [Candidatus Atribacteria bacterium]
MLGKNFTSKLITSFLVLLIITTSLIQLERQPPLWWDEGWTLVVARNWAVDSFYGRYLSGELDTPSLAGGFPVVAQVAASFRLFGVGVWQGRLPGVLFLWVAFALLYYLADRLYNQKVAISAVIVTLLMSVGPWLNPLIIGRQVLGEIPTVFYLLAGYACLWSALHKRTWMILLAIVFFAIAIRVKAQVPPFWLASMFLPLFWAIYRRWAKIFVLLLFTIVGTQACANYGIAWLQNQLIAGNAIQGNTVAGLLDVTAVVLNRDIRIDAILIAFTIGLPTTMGLGFVAMGFIKKMCQLKSFNELSASDPVVETVRLALLGLTGSWMAWFVFFGMSNVRYLFPVVFIGSIYTAALLNKLTFSYNLKATIMGVNALLLHRSSTIQNWGALLSILLFAITVPFNIFTIDLISVYNTYNPDGKPAAVKVAEFLNANTPSKAIIETYDSELFFLLNRHYHYPPDDVHVSLIRRNDLKQDVTIEYNPIIADPDYLVIGHFSRKWGLYDGVISSGKFRKIKEYPGYEIYLRIR